MHPPLFRGAFARAVIAAIWLLLVAAPSLWTQAEAAVHHRFRAHRHHNVPAQAVRRHRRIVVYERAIEPDRENPFAWSGPLFQPRERVSMVATPGAVAAFIAARAEALDVPTRLAIAVARFESGLRMSMRGAAGERGAMQVLPQTARQLGVVGDLYGEAGIEAGVRYLKLAMAMHREAGWCAVASAYNSGVWRRSRCTAYGRAVTALAALR